MAGVTRLDSLELLLRADEPIGASAAERLRAVLERRLAHEPVARILGQSGFYGLDLAVTPDVLDPRADTETLVDAALLFLRESKIERPSILDLGVGSGAILCALLSSAPDALGFAVDVSEAACRVAQANLDGCGLRERSAVLCGFWTDAIEGRFDLIVSNPPYIADEERAGLAPEVIRHDPPLALFGGKDGLDSYRRLAENLGKFLNPGAQAFLEIGWRQGESVCFILRSAGFRDLSIVKDHGGRDRVVIARQG